MGFSVPAIVTEVRQFIVGPFVIADGLPTVDALPKLSIAVSVVTALTSLDSHYCVVGFMYSTFASSLVVLSYPVIAESGNGQPEGVPFTLNA